MNEIKAAWQEGYEAGKLEVQKKLDMCEERYNHLWKYVQDHNKVIAKLTAERNESRGAWKAEADNVTQLLNVVSEFRAERDAAVAALKELGRSEGVPCGDCKHFWEDSPTACKECTDENERINWEWSGLSLENKTSDKEVKE